MRQRRTESRGFFDIEHPSTWRRLRDGTLDCQGELDLFPLHDWDFFVEEVEF
jgi:hypothetical protein